MASSSMNTTLHRKLRKVLETTTTDDSNLMTALLSLDTFYGANTLSARRNLRGQVEARSLQTHKAFLAAFQEVQSELHCIEADVKAMEECCSQMESRLADTQAVAGDLVGKTRALQEERARAQTCHHITTQFLARFQLTSSEVAVLRTGVTPRFFDVLARAQAITDDCKLLLRMQHAQQAGLDILDAMFEVMEQAYEKLYHWVNGQIDDFAQEQPDLTQLLRRAIATLHRHRPAVLRYCVEKVEGVRSEAVSTAFVKAVTQGGPHGIPRAMDVHAHDPLRFIGDMLAWLHQALATEREFLTVLFVPDDDGEGSGGGNTDGVSDKRNGDASPTGASPTSSSSSTSSVVGPSPRTSEVQSMAQQVLAAVFSGVCQPFQLRVQQCLASEMDLVVLFKVVNLLSFYESRIGEMIGAQTALPQTFHACMYEAMKAFQEALNAYAEKLDRIKPIASPDLTPSVTVHECLHVLVQILMSYDASLAPVSMKEDQFEPTLQALLDPIIRMCHLACAALTDAEGAVYMVNNVHAMASALSPYSFVGRRQAELQERCDDAMAKAVIAETDALLKRCELAHVLDTFRGADGQTPASQLPGVSGALLAKSLRKLEAILFGQSVPFPCCERIVDSQLRMETHTRAMKVITTAYRELHDIISDPANLFVEAASIVQYDPDQFAMLAS